MNENQLDLSAARTAVEEPPVDETVVIQGMRKTDALNFTSETNQRYKMAASSPNGTADGNTISAHGDDVNALLAAELNQMSFNERELVYEEIHGVERLTEENPKFIQECLLEMEKHLQKIPKKAAYDLAEQTSPGYVKDRGFRLMFLRAKYFDSNKAALSLVLFLDEKLKYFGPDVLTRPIYLSDLDKDDLALLKSGSMQILPSRDRGGRAIYGDFNLINDTVYARADNVVKSFFYSIMTVVEDEETQQRGMVGLFYFVGAKTFKFDPEVNTPVSRLLECLPYRFSAIHICSDDPRLKMFKSLLMLTLGRDRRVRLRIHDGTHLECQYSLMTFGMPVSFLPVTDGGEVKNINHMKWIAKRKVKEAALKRKQPFEGIDLPSNNDILVGRGKPIGDHVGNIRLRVLVNLHLEEYEQASKQEKTAIAMKVVKAMKEFPCRFLKRNDDGWWAPVSDEVARGKVSTCFRSARNVKSVEGSSVEMENSKRMKLHPSRETPCLGTCWGDEK